MELLEHRAQWQADYEAGWLAHYRQTRTLDWRRYVHPRNSAAPPGAPVDLRPARLLLISSAGAYLRATQQPFDAAHPLGDYTTRLRLVLK